MVRCPICGNRFNGLWRLCVHPFQGFKAMAANIKSHFDKQSEENQKQLASVMDQLNKVKSLLAEKQSVKPSRTSEKFEGLK